VSTVTQEIITEIRDVLPADDVKPVWTAGDLLRIGAMPVTQEIGGFGHARHACAQSAIGLGYQALFGR
jgi:hypothetical protein